MNYFCSKPFASMQVHNEFAVAPCCIWIDDKVNNKVETFDTYFTSDQIKDVQQKLINNQPPHQCMSCYDQEKRSGHSLRTISEEFESLEQQIRSQAKSYPYFDIQDIQIVTSNICNLKCLPCGGPSYIRLVELQKMGMLDYTPKMSSINLDAILRNLKSLTSLNNISFIGGEPFADKITFKIIDQLIETGQSKNIRVDMNTNLTLCTRENLSKLRDNFKEVMIRGSIDGVGEINDYLRYPSVWNEIDQVVDLIYELEIPFIVTTALTNLSLLKYDQVIDWAKQKGIQDLFLSKVVTPKPQAFDQLPTKLKMQMREKFLKLRSQDHTNRTHAAIDACIDICSKIDDEEPDMFNLINLLDKHDKFRNTNFQTLWPELNDYR